LDFGNFLAFLCAIQGGDLSIIKLIFKSTDNPRILLTQTTDDGKNALFFAFERNDYSVVQFLIQNNAQVETRRWVPLMKIMMDKRSSTYYMEELMKISQNVFEKDDYGKDVFDYAKKLGEIYIPFFVNNGFNPHERVLDNNFLFEPENSSSSLAELMNTYVIHNRLDLLKSIISSKNCTLEIKGKNILVQSIESYKMEIFDFIVKNLDLKMLNVKNEEGLLPIHIGLQRSNYHVVRTFCILSESSVKIDHMCFLKTRIHKGLFEYLKQWNVLKSNKTSDISFRFQ
jgi:hypothetical protein